MHEDLLRHIWSKQLFDRSRLVTSNGRAVRILHTGILHRGSGPDFRNAAVEIDGTIYRGDIEFHRTFDDWKIHGHHSDPAYNAVVLHVVMHGKPQRTTTMSGRDIPAVILEPFLLTPLQSLSDQLTREEFSNRNFDMRCFSRNDEIHPDLMNEWIRIVYRQRLEEKVRRFHERLCDIIITQERIIGEPHPPYNDVTDPNDIPLPDSNIDNSLFRLKLPWEQLLYEEVMDGLGYSNNRTPMKKLAENISLIHLLRFEAELSPVQLQSILFKASGLLPEISHLSDQDSKIFVHQLHTAWNELRRKIPLFPLHQTEWSFSPTRPSNFPTIRIAAAGMVLHTLLYRSLFKSIITIAGGKYSSPESKIGHLVNLFETPDDSFWNYHYSFTEATHRRHALLGESRTLDILVNTIIPFICLYATIFGKRDLTEHCVNIAVELPALEDNLALRQMNKLLVKGKMKIDFAYQQQGLIQLHKSYCAKERCRECEIGKAVFHYS